MAKQHDAGKLNKRHLEALSLLATNNHTIKEVAKLTKFNLDHLYDLCEGNTAKAGTVALAFKAEYRKIEKEQAKKIKSLTKANKELVLEMLNQRLVDLKQRGKFDPRELTSILNALNKATPNVEIDQLNQFNSMNPQEIAIEFRRLSAIARDVKRTGVSAAERRGSASLSGTTASNERLLAESEN